MSEVIMGITVEEVEARIEAIREKAMSQEGYDIKSDLDKLKTALHANPDIVNSLSEEHLGDAVIGFRSIHKEFFQASVATSAAKKKKAAAPKKPTATELATIAQEIDLDEL